MTGYKKKYDHIIWDWNGTLLNDVDIVIEAMNTLLKKRGLPLLDADRYKEIFTFPVKDYYYKLGFDFYKEPFEVLASEFIYEFSSEKYNFNLFDGVEQVLFDLDTVGYRQYILSATRQPELETAVETAGISKYFRKLVGLDNHYAVSKIDAGIVLFEQLKLEPGKVLLIGDTLHDLEVSKALGCDCLLISRGHQSFSRISESKATILNDILEVPNYLITTNQY